MSREMSSRLSMSSLNLAPAASSSSGGSGGTIARKRYRARDDAIRRKVDLELIKKRPSGRRSQPSSAPRTPVASVKPGTASSLKPSLPVTIRQSARVIDAAQLMAARRADALLVVDSQDRLCGIVTDKDLAFRVVAENLDVNNTKVFEIMTKNVTYASSDSPASEALSTMVAGAFRHLPVLDEDGDVVGVLDITKCLFEAVERIEKMFGASKKLTDALQDAQKDWASTGFHTRLSQEFDQLRQRMLCPDLNSILTAENLMPLELGLKATVRDAARTMKQFKSTAVLVFEDSTKLAGIFTSKDIVLRVMAVKADPDVTSIIRVMTPHPDTVEATTSIQDALKMMHDNRYLHLPVTNGKRVVGLVDVLKITYSVLEKLNASDKNAEGPMWNRFWGASLEDSDRKLSNADVDEDHDGDVDDTSDVHTADIQLSTPPHPTQIKPSDSASVVSESITSLSYAARHLGYEQNQMFIFKFKDPYTHAVHRVAAPMNLSILVQLLTEKLGGHTEVNHLSYVDDEGDDVQLSSDVDLETAVIMAKHANWKRLLLTINNTYVDPLPLPQRRTESSESGLNKIQHESTSSDLYNARRNSNLTDSPALHHVHDNSIMWSRGVVNRRSSSQISSASQTTPISDFIPSTTPSTAGIKTEEPQSISPLNEDDEVDVRNAKSTWLMRVLDVKDNHAVMVGASIATVLGFVGLWILRK